MPESMLLDINRDVDDKTDENIEEDAEESNAFLLNDDVDTSSDDDTEVLSTIVEGLDEDAAAYLLVAKQEASQLDARQCTSIKQLVSVSARPKKRCAYLEHMLRLDAAGSLKPAPGNVVSRDASCGEDTCAHEAPHAEDTWDAHALRLFHTFREHLQSLSTLHPALSGEHVNCPPALERDWDQEQWEHTILTTGVRVSVLGVCDSVRASAVVEAVASLLAAYNKAVARQQCGESSSARAPPTGSHEDDRALKAAQVNVSPFILKRILQWGFAALASLDSLQAMDGGISHSLQVMRRCCRWLLLQRQCSLPLDVESDARLIELLVETYFQQR